MGKAALFGADCYRQGWKTIFSGGLTAEISFWKNFNLETGVMFLPGGAIYKSGDEETGYQETVSLDYVDIPLLAKYYFWQRKSLNGYLAIGPAVLLNIGARLEVVSAGEKFSVNLDSLKGKELSFNLMAGAELKTGPVIFLFELVYNLGTNSISREAEEEVRNRRFLCFFGFRF
ncbi:MAG: PorT family protein [Candidatus Aminicenantes bacterium]|nr:PorT family protein [Candidatus Aminicenantes bacterium]